LVADERAFLGQLPYTVERADALFVHASAAEPAKWAYIVGQKAAEHCLAATEASKVFVGHLHHPSLYFSVRNRVLAFMPQPGVPVSMTQGRRWLAIAGSVGQPRDGNPAAAYLTFDAASSQAIFFRVPYDWMGAAAKIRAAGLPEDLATRLGHGE
jgi:diadenosine tetraphosphatase ApaH/serine/threonine PP2A family protein phosphatase